MRSREKRQGVRDGDGKGEREGSVKGDGENWGKRESKTG